MNCWVGCIARIVEQQCVGAGSWVECLEELHTPDQGPGWRVKLLSAGRGAEGEKVSWYPPGHIGHCADRYLRPIPPSELAISAKREELADLRASR